jgi:xylose isomerase
MTMSFGQKSVKEIQPSEVSPSNGHDDNLPFHGDICGPVAATLNEDMFNIVISRWREAYESLKETNDYNTLSAAGSLMKTMVRECLFINYTKAMMLHLVPSNPPLHAYQTCLVFFFLKDQDQQTN